MTMLNSLPVRSLAAAALLALSGCTISLRSISTKIEPGTGSVTHQLPLPRSGWVRVSHFPHGGLAVYRTSADGDGAKILEGYDDTLGLLWSRPMGFYHYGEGLTWLGQHDSRVLMPWRALDPTGDSVAYWIRSYDMSTGTPGDSGRLAIFPNSVEDEELVVVPTRILTSPDTSLIVSYTAELRRVSRRRGYDSIHVRAQMIDTDMRHRGTLAVDLPILHIAEPKDVHYRLLGEPIADTHGRVHLALATGRTTVRIYQLDIANSSVASIDIETPPVYQAEMRSA